MPWLKAIILEIYGLFVEDGSFAMAIVVWMGLASFGLPRLHILPNANGPILFAGLLVILLESVLRRAAK